MHNLLWVINIFVCGDETQLSFQVIERKWASKHSVLNEGKQSGRRTLNSLSYENCIIIWFQVMSSPVRDLQHALCQFHLTDLTSNILASGMSNYTIKTTLNNCVLKDVVKEQNILEQK
jgi:hypothetical protein